MPATSQKQRRLFAVALHHPEKLRPENRRLSELPDKTLHEYAATKEKGLPKRKHPMSGALGK